MFIAELIDWLTVNQFHDEKWPTAGGGTCVKDTCDVGMIQDAQNLSLAGESGDDLLSIEPRPDDLDRDLPLDGFF